MISPQEILDLPTLPQNPRKYVVLRASKMMVIWSIDGPKIYRCSSRKTLTAREYKEAVRNGEILVVLEEI